jgi:release factor glutamine methyltransferase
MFGMRPYYPPERFERMTRSTTVALLLAEGKRLLRNAPSGAAPESSADLDAELLLAHLLEAPRGRLLSQEEKVVDPAVRQHYLKLLERRTAGEPLAYLTGRREFWSLDLCVGPGVLVPRPETELLVERALALQPASAATVADLGTGSGAIALALAGERPGWQVLGTDVSAAALAVARANAVRLGLSRVEFREGSWFEPLRARRFDLLLSNPPYVAADDPLLAQPGLAHEPRLALTPGTDALACLRLLARGAGAHLADAGWLLLEHGAQHGAQVRHELVLAGFRYVRSHRDLAGHERITEGQHGQV